MAAARPGKTLMRIHGGRPRPAALPAISLKSLQKNGTHFPSTQIIVCWGRLLVVLALLGVLVVMVMQFMVLAF